MKMNSSRQIYRFKGKLIAKSFLQKAGIDYGELFSPIARMETISLVVVVDSLRNWTLHQMDVKLAFLNGSLKEEVYVMQPPGFEVKGQENKVYKLIKALYFKKDPRV